MRWAACCIKKGERTMSKITIQNAKKQYGDTTVIEGLNLEIRDGELFTLLGPSGCGKTTLLRMIAGFNSIEGGDFYFNEERINDKEPSKRNIGMVFQNYAIFPHMTVAKNVAYGLKNRKTPKDEIARETDRFLEIMQIKQYADRLPENLSGGQQQRVALARALVIKPDVLLMDEPLSNLDAKLRVSMRTEIRRIQQEVGITAIYVTHDQSEAMALSDSIIIMNKGVVAQIGSPQEIYYHPNSEFVADFIGEANFLRGKCVALEGGSGVLQLADTQVRVAATENMTVGEDYTIVLRPESAGLVPEGNLKCRVVLSCFMGAYQNYHVMVGDTLVKLTDYNPKNHRIYQVGETCALTFEPDGVHVL